MRYLIAACYVFTMSAVVVSLVWARQQALATYGSPHAQSHWDTWRSDAATQSSADGEAVVGPVVRRPPKSPQPPALVLMRDFFGVCMAFALVLSSALFLTLVVVVQGMFSKTEILSD